MTPNDTNFSSDDVAAVVAILPIEYFSLSDAGVSTLEELIAAAGFEIAAAAAAAVETATAVILFCDVLEGNNDDGSAPTEWELFVSSLPDAFDDENDDYANFAEPLSVDNF